MAVTEATAQDGRPASAPTSTKANVKVPLAPLCSSKPCGIRTTHYSGLCHVHRGALINNAPKFIRANRPSSSKARAAKAQARAQAQAQAQAQIQADTPVEAPAQATQPAATKAAPAPKPPSASRRRAAPGNLKAAEVAPRVPPSSPATPPKILRLDPMQQKKAHTELQPPPKAPKSLSKELNAAAGLAAKIAEAKQRCMSREQYRRLLQKAGLACNSDQQVYHILKNGPDHPDNYHFVQNQAWAQAIEGSHDEISCFMAGMEAARKAVAIAQLLGSSTGAPYTGPGAEELYKAGQAAMKLVRVEERSRKKDTASTAKNQGQMSGKA